MYRSVCLPVLCLLLLVGQRGVLGGQPLHERIDRLIEGRFEGRQAAGRADDAAFLRRVWLDLAGRIPSSDEARRFLDDRSADKRQRLIDRLLAAPTYAPRMRELFHVVLMERRGEHPEWERFLETSFQANRPWDQLVRSILRPGQQDEERRGAAFFTTKRLEKYGQNPTDFPGLTNDVARLFLGADLQCAQCHDHLYIDDYTQREFQGLFAIYQNTFIRTDVPFPAVGEKPLTGKLEFVSAFDPTQQQTGPRIPFGPEFALPEAESEQAGQDEDDDGQAPAATPLALLAERLPVADNERFTKNIVNRLWFVMMGRGLVHPLDLHHSDNGPSHPELLDLLAREFAAQQFDIRWLLRELALTETYQRSSLIPEGQPVPPPDSYLVANQRRLSAEQLLWSTLQATGDLRRLTQPGQDGQPQPELEELKGRFLNAFANLAGEPEEEYNATVKAALFQRNDGKMLELVRSRPGNLVERLAQIDEPSELVEELFLSLFTRRPSDQERVELAGYLAENSDHRERALGHLVWAMLTSMEFSVNH